MPFYSTKEMLEDADRKGYAVGAFNINNMETVHAIIEGAVELRSPVIIEVSEGAVRYMGMKMAVSMVRTLAEEVPIPVALHLDHGKNMETIEDAIRCGFSSVMIDASEKPYDENVRITKSVVEKSHDAGVSVEAELGRLPGSEDDLTVEEREAFLVDPDMAGSFVQETGIDFLAPAVGTSHGAFKYEGESKIDFERLRLVKSKTNVPLVLHGASSVNRRLVEEAQKQGLEIEGAKGLNDDVLKRAVKEGINKVNTDTDLRIAFTTAVRRVLKEDPSVFDPRKILGPGKDFMREIVKERIGVLGSAHKAS
jgi:fructose-bisphosphate aldolase class II